MDAKSRMELLLQHLKLNAVSFSKSIGKERPQLVYDILKGKTKNISHSLANQIISVFPEIRKPWLIAGDGPMLESGISENPPSAEAPPSDSLSGDLVKQALDQMRVLVENNGKLVETNRQLVDANREQFDRMMQLLERSSRNERDGRECLSVSSS